MGSGIDFSGTATEGVSGPDSGVPVPRSIPRDIVQQFDDTLERFRRGEIEKHTALLEIFTDITHSRTTKAAQSIALKQWTVTMDQISNSNDEASQRGIHAVRESKGGELRDDGLRHVQGPIHLPSDDRQQLSRSRNRGRDEDEPSDSGGDDSGDDGSMSGGNRRRIDENRLPWHKKDLAAQETASPAISKNIELLKYFGRNIPRVKQLVILSQTAPAGIPPSPPYEK